MVEVFSFEVSVQHLGTTIINHISSGKAKSEYLRDISEYWSGVHFTQVRCRKIGKPFSSEQFLQNAKYRGMPDVRCGQRVKVGAGVGTIVGHNSSANFNVLFDADSPKYAGLKLNCHPSEIVLTEPNNE